MRVPAGDTSPPSAVVTLQRPDGTGLARAGHPGPSAGATVALEASRFRGSVTGAGHDSGVARVRVSVQEEVTCSTRSGTRVRLPRRRYFPPSQIERIRSSPGAALPLRETHVENLRLSLGRCPDGARVHSVAGELWGDVTNGVGLESVPPHVRFRWSP